MCISAGFSSSAVLDWEPSFHNGYWLKSYFHVDLSNMVACFIKANIMIRGRGRQKERKEHQQDRGQSFMTSSWKWTHQFCHKLFIRNSVGPPCTQKGRGWQEVGITGSHFRRLPGPPIQMPRVEFLRSPTPNSISLGPNPMPSTNGPLRDSLNKGIILLSTAAPQQRTLLTHSLKFLFLYKVCQGEKQSVWPSKVILSPFPLNKYSDSGRHLGGVRYYALISAIMWPPVRLMWHQGWDTEEPKHCYLGSCPK